MRKSLLRKPASPLLNRKSESIQKCNAPSIPRRFVISGENLSRSSSSAKQGAGHDMSESNINKEKMRKKHKFVTQVTMEAEKTEVHPESIALQTKKITGHSFKSRLKRKLQKLIVPDNLALGKSEKLMDCQGMEEHVHSASLKRKRRLMKKYLQCSPDKVDSGLDLPLAEEDIDIEDRISLQRKLSLKIKDAGNPTSEAHYEGHTTLQQKLDLENKSTGSDAGNVLNYIQRKCGKRMKKLIQTQKEQIQEFQRVWEDKILKVENDHCLEAAFVRAIYGKGPEIMQKLKILDDKFAKKVAEENLLKDTKLKDLEAEQLAARNEESQKSATWLSDAKACISSKLTGCTIPEKVGCNAPNGNPSNSINSCQKNEGGMTFSYISIPAVVEQINQPKPLGAGESTFANLAASGERVSGQMQSLEPHGDVLAELEIVDLSTNTPPVEGFGEGSAIDFPDAEQLTQPNHFGCGERVIEKLLDSGERVSGEIQSLEPHGDVSAELPETVANEIVDSGNPEDMITDAPIEGSGDGDAIDLPGAEQLTQPKHFGSGQRIFANLPDSGERDPGEIQSLKLLKDIPAELAENETVIANPVELSTITSIKKRFGEGDATYLIDGLPNERNETDETTIDDLDLAGQVLKTSEQTKASPHPCLLLPLRVQDDQDPMSAKIQDYGVQYVRKLNSSSTEVVVSEHVDTASNFLSDVELQDPERPAISTQGSSRPEVATTKIVDSVIAEQSSLKLQDQDASVINDQVALQIEVSNSKRVDAAPVAASEIVSTAKTLQSNTELQDTVEPAVETRYMSRIEFAPSENTDDRMPMLSRTELQDKDALIAENQVGLEIEVSNSGLADNATFVQVQSHIGTSTIENCEQLGLMPTDAFPPGCNQLLFVEFESQNHNPSGAAETEMPLQESTSQSSHEASVEVSASFQNNVAAERVESTIEIPHQDILQVGVVSYLPGQAARDSPSLFSEPLQKELERIDKEIDELQKSYEDTVSLLKSNCAKEKQEIQNKYELKLQDAQSQLILKKNRLDQNQNKIMMNKLLADTINYNRRMQHGSPSNPMQYQHIVRPDGATPCPPIVNQQFASLLGQAVQQISVPHSTRLGPGTSHSFPAGHVQSSQQAAANSFGINGVIPRPQGINAVHHPTGCLRVGGGNICYTAPHLQATIPAAASSQQAAANSFGINGVIPRPQGINAVHHPTSCLRVGGGNICYTAPHLQATIPAAASSMATDMLSALRSLQHQQQTPPLAAAPQLLSSTQNPQHPGWQPVQSHASLSALGLLTNLEHHHPPLPGYHTPSLPAISSSFGWQQSCFDTLGNVQRNQSICAAASNTICLSDDE